VRYSFKFWGQQASWPDIRQVWIDADRGGAWDAVWLNDHLHPPRAGPDQPIFDSFSLLAAGAAVTSRLRLGVMVAANTFRHPAVLAKMAVTIDHLSGGRFELGIGAGWLSSEHRSFGIALPPLAERFRRLDETFTIVDGLMTEPRFSFEGAQCTITGAELEPKPVQRPRVPFVVGGSGPRRTIPIAARWADQWNYPDYGEVDPVETFVDRLALLHRRCREIGRDPATIEASVQLRYPGDPARIIETIDAYRAAGADHAVVSFMPPADTSLPALVGDALPR
jgi:probable F420-dependent oxidoreductase